MSLLLGLGLGACSKDPASSANSATGLGGDGQAGSTARFALLGNKLYAVDAANLRTFDLSTPSTPVPGPVVSVGVGIETIFPQAPYLFIGSQQGLYIFNTANGNPQQTGFYEHAVSCDPVVVDGHYAYVTLRSDGPCGRGISSLDVVDLNNLSQPVLARSFPLVQPYGLGTDSSQVFVCDQGIKVFDARNTPNLRQMQAFSVAATDVVARRGVLLVTGTDGLYQYRYTAAGSGSLQQLSRIPVAN